MLSYVARFGIALAVAAVAVVLNFAWVQQNTNSVPYIIVNQKIDKDEIIRDVDLTSLSLPKKYKDRYDQIFVPYEDRFWIIGKSASRIYEKDELMLRQNLENEFDNLPQIDVLGPFQLYSVGSRLVGSKIEQSSYSANSGIPITFIAKRVYDKDNELTFDKNTRRLLQLIEYEKSMKQRNNDDSWKILSITIFPDDPDTSDNSIHSDHSENSETKNNVSTTPYQLADDEMAITVEVPNVPILSNVLMNSKNPRIGFIVPSDVLKSNVMKNLE
jgi:hypothetical protein